LEDIHRSFETNEPHSGDSRDDDMSTSISTANNNININNINNINNNIQDPKFKSQLDINTKEVEIDSEFHSDMGINDSMQRTNFEEKNVDLLNNDSFMGEGSCNKPIMNMNSNS